MLSSYSDLYRIREHSRYRRLFVAAIQLRFRMNSVRINDAIMSKILLEEKSDASRIGSDQEFSLLSR